MDLISKHLRSWARSEFVWGKTDCCVVLADYVLDVTGRDGASHLRGLYSTRRGAENVGRLAEGHEAAVADCAARAGLPRTDNPQRGDIGVLQVRQYQFAGLFLGDRWAVKSIDGLLFLSHPKVLAAWSVEG